MLCNIKLSIFDVDGSPGYGSVEADPLKENSNNLSHGERAEKFLKASHNSLVRLRNHSKIPKILLMGRGNAGKLKHNLCNLPFPRDHVDIFLHDLGKNVTSVT